MAEETNAPNDEDGATTHSIPTSKIKQAINNPVVRIILLIIVLLTLLGGTSFAALSYLGVFDTPETAAEVHLDEQSGSISEASEPLENVTPSVNYYPLEPEFIVNFMARGRQRYMQVGLSLKITDAAGIGLIEMHEPLLRNDIVILLSSQDYLNLQSDSGRLNLQRDLLSNIRQIMTQETGQPVVDEVYFTSYVLQ